MFLLTYLLTLIADPYLLSCGLLIRIDECSEFVVSVCIFCLNKEAISKIQFKVQLL